MYMCLQAIQELQVCPFLHPRLADPDNQQNFVKKNIHAIKAQF